MDYEKAYKESFGVAKCLHEAGDTTTKKRMERLFPQLAESKDERIRKGLIEALKTSKTVGELKFVIPEPTREECIAYLEKQKEQKPAEVDESTKRLNDNWMKQHFDDYEEQKPAEWSEDDEQWLESIIGEYERRLSVDKDHAAVIQIKIDFLKHLHPQSHWKPSEEQMKALYSALNDANDAISLYSNKVFPLYEEISRKRFDTLESLYNDLKKLM